VNFQVPATPPWFDPFHPSPRHHPRQPPRPILWCRLSLNTARAENRAAGRDNATAGSRSAGCRRATGRWCAARSAGAAGSPSSGGQLELLVRGTIPSSLEDQGAIRRAAQTDFRNLSAVMGSQSNEPRRRVGDGPLLVGRAAIARVLNDGGTFGSGLARHVDALEALGVLDSVVSRRDSRDGEALAGGAIAGACLDRRIVGGTVAYDADALSGRGALDLVDRRRTDGQTKVALFDRIA